MLLAASLSLTEGLASVASPHVRHVTISARPLFQAPHFAPSNARKIVLSGGKESPAAAAYRWSFAMTSGNTPVLVSHPVHGAGFVLEAFDDVAKVTELVRAWNKSGEALARAVETHQYPRVYITFILRTHRG